MMGNFTGLPFCIFVPRSAVLFAVALFPIREINLTKSSYVLEELLAVAHTFLRILVCNSIVQRQLLPSLERGRHRRKRTLRRRMIASVTLPTARTADQRCNIVGAAVVRGLQLPASFHAGHVSCFAFSQSRQS